MCKRRAGREDGGVNPPLQRMKSARLLWFSNDPSRHAAVILHDRRLQSIDQNRFHALGKSHQLLFVDEIPRLPVGHGVESVAHRFEIHADARGEATKKETAGTKDAPEFGEHGVKLRVVASEVKNGVAENDVGKVGGIRQLLDASDLEVFVGEAGA